MRRKKKPRNAFLEKSETNEGINYNWIFLLPKPTKQIWKKEKAKSSIVIHFPLFNLIRNFLLFSSHHDHHLCVVIWATLLFSSFLSLTFSPTFSTLVFYLYITTAKIMSTTSTLWVGCPLLPERKSKDEEKKKKNTEWIKLIDLVFFKVNQWKKKKEKKEKQLNNLSSSIHGDKLSPVFPTTSEPISIAIWSRNFNVHLFFHLINYIHFSVEKFPSIFQDYLIFWTINSLFIFVISWITV